MKPIIWLLTKRKGSYYAVDVAAISMNEGNLPHFGLIFNLSVEKAEEMRKENVLPLTFLLGEHSDEQKWDFVEDNTVENNRRTLLLIPKRYVLISLIILAYFIRLVPKKTTNAAKA